MEFVTYILYSFGSQRFYIGYSTNLILRIHWHNNGKKGFTTRFRPWKVVHVEFFETKEQAINMENYFKSGKGRDWFKAHFNVNERFISD
ncbi:MAG: GIY-YIG nuclease family protein [Bacteroidetes bacterium]|nr:GIY-YIG nuclease family protein [Bacteroidota bacterium]